MRRLLGIGLVAAGAAVAEETPPKADASRINPLGVTAGFGVIGGQTLYKGVDKPDTLVVPFLGYEGDRFYVRGLTAGARVWANDDLRFDLVAQPRFDQLNPGDSEALSGMERRRRSLDGGARAGWRSGPWGISASALTDLLGRHRGQELSLGVGYQVGPPFLFVRPGVGLTWQSAELTSYYYGVSTSEERVERPAYAPGTAINVSAGVSGRYAISRHWGTFVSVNHTWLDDAVAESPVVARDRRWSGIAALTYTFR